MKAWNEMDIKEQKEVFARFLASEIAKSLESGLEFKPNNRAYNGNAGNAYNGLNSLILDAKQHENGYESNVWVGLDDALKLGANPKEVWHIKNNTKSKNNPNGFYDKASIAYIRDYEMRYVKARDEQGNLIPLKDKEGNLKHYSNGEVIYENEKVPQRDKEGNIRDKPLKSIAQGSKGIEVLFPNNLSLVKNVIVTENIFDSLAYLELQGLEPKESVLISTAGQFNAQKLELFLKSFFKQLKGRQQGAYNHYLKQEEQWQELVRQGRASDDFNSVVVETYTDIIKNYQREKNALIYNKQVERTREYRKPKPVNKPQDSFNVILAFDNDIKGKGYKEKCEGILYALTQQFPTIYTPFSKDCNDDLKLAHIIENKAINIDTMAEFLESSLEKLKDNYTSTQEKENIMDKLEQIDSIKPFNERLKGILENAKENLQVQSYTKGRGR
ncbi:ArdC family protein [Helicobacter pylori]